MSIFSKIKDAIFGKKATEEPSAPVAQAQTQDPEPATPATPAAVAMSEVDVEAVLTQMATASAQKLNWRTSIVDLMKLVGMESSLAERRELAGELGYSGDTSDTATMNIWLHKQVMTKLAENGGKVPASLLN